MTPICFNLHANVRAVLNAALLGTVVLSLVSCGKPKSSDEKSPESQPATSASQSGSKSGGTAGTEASNPQVQGAPGTQMGAAGAAGAGSNPADATAASGTGTTPAGQSSPGMAPGANASESPYTTAELLIKDLLAKLQSGDWNGFLDLAGPQASTGANKVRLRSLIVDRKYHLNDANPFTVTDKGEGAKLVGVNLLPGSEDTSLGDQKIEMELVRNLVARWGVADVRVPDVLELAAAKMAATAAAAAGEPLQVAKQFLDAVVKKDFATARRNVDIAKLSDEKLAALFIVVEEGSFKPNREKPLISTMARDNVAWVIARLESAEQQSDFGIEMARAAASSPWLIVGLNFSKLIQRVAAQAGAGDVAYSPLQTDLKGGEQIVIFFEFDGISVNPRAEKQLRIIGDILRADPKRTLTIGGHADALGTDEYNKSLSERRADAVRQFLMTYGIPGPQILTQGFGRTVPKAPNVNPDGTDNPSGRAQNRRAEVYLKF